MGNNEAKCLVHEALSGMVCAHPVADLAALRDTAADIPERDTAQDGSLVRRADEERKSRAGFLEGPRQGRGGCARIKI